VRPAPLIFTPILKEKVWGGDHLRAIAGRPMAAGARIGESWEISDRPGDMSVVAEGPEAGRTLGSLVRTERAALFGAEAPASLRRFPLLIKLMDAAETLSLQVHPSGAHGAKYRLGSGKTELWYVLRAVPGAVMFMGLRHGVTRRNFARMLEEDRAEEALNCFAVRAGDVIFCPAGTVHAIGAGLVLVEIQQNSDSTLRVYDWGRRPGGRPRPLHVEQALAVIRFGVRPRDKVIPRVMAESPFLRERLVRCAEFAVERWRLRRRTRLEGGAMAVFSVVEGSGAAAGDGFARPLRVGDTILMPASVCAWDFRPKPTMTLLRTTIR